MRQFYYKNKKKRLQITKKCEKKNKKQQPKNKMDTAEQKMIPSYF